MKRENNYFNKILASKDASISPMKKLEGCQALAKREMNDSSLNEAPYLSIQF